MPPKRKKVLSRLLHLLTTVEGSREKLPRFNLSLTPFKFDSGASRKRPGRPHLIRDVYFASRDLQVGKGKHSGLKPIPSNYATLISEVVDERGVSVRATRVLRPNEDS